MPSWAMECLRTPQWLRRALSFFELGLQSGNLHLGVDQLSCQLGIGALELDHAGGRVGGRVLLRGIVLRNRVLQLSLRGWRARAPIPCKRSAWRRVGASRSKFGFQDYAR